MKKGIVSIVIVGMLVAFALAGCGSTQQDGDEGNAPAASQAAAEAAPSDDAVPYDDIQFILYVGTNDKDTDEPVCTPDEAKATARDILVQHFGGYTIQDAEGGWVGDDGTLYQEYTLVIYLSDTDADAVHAACDDLIDAFNQSSILVSAGQVTTEFYDGQ